MAGPSLLMVPTAFMGKALLALYYFRVAFILLARLIAQKWDLPVWRHSIQPVLREALALVTASLGAPDKLTFSLTHVLLAAQLLVLVVYLDKIRAELRAGRP
jgi:hypothetical protein